MFISIPVYNFLNTDDFTLNYIYKIFTKYFALWAVI